MMAGFDFARELMENCAHTARQVRGSSDPKSVLIYAARQTKSKGLAATSIASLYDRVNSSSLNVSSSFYINNLGQCRLFVVFSGFDGRQRNFRMKQQTGACCNVIKLFSA